MVVKKANSVVRPVARTMTQAVITALAVIARMQCHGLPNMCCPMSMRGAQGIHANIV